MQFCRAGTLDEAVASMSEWGEAGCILAGGTDVMVLYQRGEIQPEALIHMRLGP